MLSRILSILAISIAACISHAQLDSVTYKLPAGWKEAEREGAKIFMPGNLKEGEGFLVIMSPAEDATKETPQKQFDGITARMTKGDKVLFKGDADKMPVAGGTMVAQAFVIEDEELGKNTRVISTLFVGARRVSFMVVSDPPELLTRYEKSLEALWGSFKFKPVAAKPAPPKPAAGADPNAGKAPTGDTPLYFPGMKEWRPSGRGYPLPATAIVNGKPQGMWYLPDFMQSIPKATIYAFLPDGKFCRNPIWGGGKLIDYDLHYKISPTGTGKCTVADGGITLQTTGFNARSFPYSHGKDQYGLFFKQGSATFRELRPPSTKALTGKWRALSTQYVFHANGTFEYGQVSSGDDWIAGSYVGGRYFIDGYLVVMEFTGLHTTIDMIGIVTDKQIVIGETLLVRS